MVHQQGNVDTAGVAKIHKRIAVLVARYPWFVLVGSFAAALALSFVGIYYGEFEVAVDNAGWISRGTVIAQRHSQYLLARFLRGVRDPDVWDDFEENVQPGWETDNNVAGRRLEAKGRSNVLLPHKHHVTLASGATPRSLQDFAGLDLSGLNLTAFSSGVLQGCDASWYFTSMNQDWDRRLWPVWKINEPQSDSVLLSRDALRDICTAEEATQKVLEDKGLCVRCPESDDSASCLPPFSLVFFARSQVAAGFELDCSALADEWVKYTEAAPTLVADLQVCLEDMVQDSEYYPFETFIVPESCPPLFLPFLVDTSFRNTGVLAYTSSVFATDSTLQELFDNRDDFNRGTADIVEGTYETVNDEDNFNIILVDASVITDMSLAMASAIVTMAAVLIHTRSIWLTCVGFFQIILSFPLAFFVYRFVGQITFFPFLNFIGVFILFALGADVIFVAVDKWKNARIDLTDAADVTEVAAEALPDAAGAMLLTTFTTAVAFFATAICPVAPIKCFAIFCGLLISFDYILCCAFIFPALCIYDGYRNCCCTFSRRSVEIKAEDDDENLSLIRRILSSYHAFLHKINIPVLVVCVVVFCGAAYKASTIELPNSADVRLLRETHELEKNFKWRKELVISEIDRAREGGSVAHVVFGLTPADTGNYLDPTTFTQLVLNEDFKPSKAETQLYMRDLCKTLDAQSFAERVEGGLCSFEKLDSWLSTQSISDSPSQVYTQSCGNVTGLPILEENFHDCVAKYALETYDNNFYVRGSVVKAVVVHFGTDVSFESSYEELDENWNEIQDFLDSELSGPAPEAAADFYFTSFDFWFHDTNAQLLSTAYIASAIALGTSAAVILFSSRSVILTIFSAFSIAFVLVSVVACLVFLGWKLGFLESICLAVVIGLSADFVIHFAHAYGTLPGAVDRSIRTKFAIIRMGPSILAAAFTTMCAAIVMLFCTVTFFLKFATILLVTIVAATVASFVVFVVLMDTLGPSEPAYLFDKMFPATKAVERKPEDQVAESSPAGSPNKYPFEHEGFDKEMEFYAEASA